MSAQLSFGIDIGGSGMKAAPVDLADGTLAADRFKIQTPRPATPPAMADVVAQLVAHFEWAGPVGVTFPAVVRRGVTLSAANVDKSWIGTDADALFTKTVGHDVVVVNDADAAGLAEMRYGAGRGRDGVVHRAHVRDGHRLGVVRRRRAGPEHRARAPRDRRPRRRAPSRGECAGSREALVG